MKHLLIPAAILACVWAAAGFALAVATIPALLSWRLIRGRYRAPHGRVPLNHHLRSLILERDGWRCYLCGQAIPHRERDCPLGGCPWDAHIDHVMPVAAGGSNRLTNLRASHEVCNLRKSDAVT